MKVLFIGGTGNISVSCTRVAIEKGIEVFHFNRGKRPSPFGNAVSTIHGDIANRAEMRKLLGDRRFDAVVNWIAFKKEDIEADIELFRGRVGQYLFISSASVYHKPPSHWMVTESTPAYNPFWPYSQNKIACERRLWQAYEDEHFPMTIVRPSHTYSDGWLPTVFGSDFTVAKRMIEGKPIVVHGEGQSLWTLTHADDFAVAFVGLLGDPRTAGETFQITSDEALSWDQIHQTVGAAFGATPSIVHMPSEFIARHVPELGPGIFGDKMYSLVFDNSKIKRFVPEYRARISFAEGMRRSAQWYAKHPEAMVADPKIEAQIETLLERWGSR